MHYYQFNIGDYHSHTGYLSLMEDLAYRRILDHYYLQEAPIQSDAKTLARVIGMKDYLEEVEQVLCDFFTVNVHGEISNKRVDEEIANYHAKADTARANGKRGGRPKKPTPNPEETGSKANQEPLTKNQEPVKDKAKARRFKPPLAQTVCGYMVDRGGDFNSSRSESEKFFDYYSSNGWMVGKNKMKCWKAAVRNWLKNSKGFSNGRNQQSTGSMSAVDKVRAATGLNEQGQYEERGSASEFDDGSLVASYDRDLRS